MCHGLVYAALSKQVQRWFSELQRNIEIYKSCCLLTYMTGLVLDGWQCEYNVELFDDCWFNTFIILSTVPNKQNLSLIIRRTFLNRETPRNPLRGDRRQRRFALISFRDATILMSNVLDVYWKSWKQFDKLSLLTWLLRDLSRTRGGHAGFPISLQTLLLETWCWFVQRGS